VIDVASHVVQESVDESERSAGAIEAATAAMTGGEEVLSHSPLVDITDPELTYVRPRGRSPDSNGVQQQGFGTLRSEQLRRHDIDDGIGPGTSGRTPGEIFNTRRPRRGARLAPPHDVYLTAAPSFPDPETESDS